MGRWGRPELLRMLGELAPDDVVVVCGLECLAGTLGDAFRVLEKVDRAGAGLRSLDEALDTTSGAGREVMALVRKFGAFEREQIRRRTRDGRTTARLRGGHLGRRPKLDAEQRARAIAMVISEGYTPAEVARWFGVHRSTVSRILAEALGR